MALTHLRRVRTVLQWLTLGLGGASLAVVVAAFGTSPGESLVGRLLPQSMRGEVRWVTISAEDLDKGATLPAHQNVVLHIPESVERITRQTLFGRTGDKVRYWGYCIPVDYDHAAALQRRGFPGTLFLSEKEREVRTSARNSAKRETFSVFTDLNEDRLNEEGHLRGMVRHQQEIFVGGQDCYVMADAALPVGTDEDDDGANMEVERLHGTNTRSRDSDGDGISDGLEIFRLGTFPTKRDSDGDGIPEGMEDKNRNGRRDDDETDPRIWDTDHDGLCDGLCKVDNARNIRGEDKNLNGELDDNETDPRKADTDGDGILDDQEVLNCIAAGGTDC
jgi:hypothetical protein